ncbi:hypothetical protein ADK91_21310 [Streptomyces sp. XY511]|uniref:hypothetical protein n=1 Tax=Streptomyces sp. XY511 TaxID=1519480 RepID=UPI0006AEC1AE|nr:hypothetical protein [Streptomyces sp. XY511]KOV01945.1 hypothetical protein ADK91_21310 [Streptomyces sp. XY511]
MTTTLELVPGLITTREEISAAFGCGTFQGIEPAAAAKKVFVYSDPSAGAEYGYTFDGRAEDDEHGPLYLYTGYGANGDQQLKSRNKSLRYHVEDGRELHLFVAHGKVPGSGTMRQRYIGQMTVDPITPVEVRRGLGRDNQMRDALVFRLRPAAGTIPKWEAADALKPATATEVADVEVAKPTSGLIPAQTGVKDKNAEQHSTAETFADIPGGLRKVVRREGVLMEAFKQHLLAAGHEVKTFQITLAGEVGALTPDLYDITDHVLYEAKGQTTRNNIRMAIGQLADYRRHVPKPDGLRVAVLLPSEPSNDLKDLLAEQDIHLVYPDETGFHGFPLPVT